MKRDILLKENVIHGTKEKPIHALHFEVGKGKEYPNGIFVQNHWHDYVELLLIRKGKYQVRVNLETKILEEGSLCIFNSGDLHQLSNLEEEAEHDALLFDGQILKFSYMDQWSRELVEPLLSLSLLCANVITPEQEGYDIIYQEMDHLFQIAYKEQNRWYEHCKLGLFQLMLSLDENHFLIPVQQMATISEQKNIHRYKEIISYMERHYTEPITLKELSEIASCNEQYFCRFFKKISGITPIQYLIRYRIEQACRKLTEEEQSVSEVALDCGFENISYFIKKFKEIMGMTPKEYRNYTR